MAARVAAWWRRGYDAELLACAPATDEEGQPLAWDFPHPVNRSRMWTLLRPWFLFPALFGVLSMSVPFVVRGGIPPLAVLGGRLVFVGVVSAIFATAIHRRHRPRVERLALKAYRRYRWRGTRALDTEIAAALERERTPKRLLDANAPRPHR